MPILLVFAAMDKERASRKSPTRTAVALPQMEKYNYDTRLSSGTVVTGGTLGTVMPPSVIMLSEAPVK